MSGKRKVLITGAGGFIGGRFVELFHAAGEFEVRAAVRRWGGAARIGRLPVEIVACDINDPAQVKAALAGVDSVIHCAVGPRETTVEGTRTLLKGAREAGVRRVVHISTIDVYGTAEGTFDESKPLVRTGRAYGDMKIEAEEVCQEAIKAGLPLIMLRPTLVHGPFSASWTIEFAQRLQSRPWPLPPSVTGGTCNLVYVDDLVHAARLALDAPPEAVGQAFNINGPERPTWNEYFEALNKAIGQPPLEHKAETSSRMSSALMAPVRATAKLGMKHFGKQIMGLYQSSDAAKRAMKFAEGMIKRTPTPDEFSFYARSADYPTDKAARLLGYKPRYPLAQALPRAAAWLRANGFVQTPDRGV